MTMYTSVYKVISLKALLRILTEISFWFSLLKTVKAKGVCFLSFFSSCHKLQTTNAIYIYSQCFDTILLFVVVSCSFQRKHWVYCQYQAIELIYITLSNHCHAARNNFAVVMHVRTNPYLSCIEKKMSKTKTCNYTETYTALRERAFWGEPGSICQVTSRLFYFFFFFNCYGGYFMQNCCRVHILALDWSTLLFKGLRLVRMLLKDVS